MWEGGKGCNLCTRAPPTSCCPCGCPHPQRFYFMLEPTARNAAAIAATVPAGSGSSPKGAAASEAAGAQLHSRLCVVTKKRLPDTSKPGRERHYAFVGAFPLWSSRAVGKRWGLDRGTMCTLSSAWCAPAPAS